MKAIRILFLAAGLILLFPFTTQADSPVTSTPFYEAYLDFGLVKKAHEEGIMTLSIARYLSSRLHSIDVKVAIINALSWDFNGKSNGEMYSYYLGLKYGSTIDKLHTEILTPDEMLCLGYLKILDDYFIPDEGIPLLERANELVDDSFTYGIILAIGKGQKAMESDWCEVWKLAEKVFNNEDLKQDMRDEAVQIIYDYLVLYEENCD